MLCEHNEKALVDAVAAGDPLSLELCSHVDGCPTCRATLEQERLLFAAIDSSLHSIASSTLPASFAKRIQAELPAQQPATKLPFQTWTAGAVAAAIGIAFFLAHETRRPTSPGSHSTPLPQTMAATQGNHLVPRNDRIHRSTRTERPRPEKSLEPEILISVAEEQATARYFDSRRRVGLSQTDEGENYASLEIPPITIAKLEVTPLEKPEQSAANR